MSFAGGEGAKALEKVTKAIEEHSTAVLILLVVLIILVLGLAWKAYKPAGASGSAPRSTGTAAQGFSGSMGPTVTNYNQVSDQTGVGDTAGTLNINMTGSDILASSDFGCANRVPFGDEDAWGWLSNRAGSAVRSYNDSTEGMYGRAYHQGAKPLVTQGMGQTIHHLQRGLSGKSEGFRARGEGVSGGVLDSQLTQVMRGH